MSPRIRVERSVRFAEPGRPTVLETSRNPLIPCGLCEIGFVWSFFSRSPSVALRSPLQNRASQGQRRQVERQFAMWTSYAQCNPQRQVLRVSRVMKLLKIGRVAGCDWTANGPQVSANGRRGLRYGTTPSRLKLQTQDFVIPRS